MVNLYGLLYQFREITATLVKQIRLIELAQSDRPVKGVGKTAGTLRFLPETLPGSNTNIEFLPSIR